MWKSHLIFTFFFVWVFHTLWKWCLVSLEIHPFLCCSSRQLGESDFKIDIKQIHAWFSGRCEFSPGQFLLNYLLVLYVYAPSKMQKLLRRLALYCVYMITIGQIWHGVERKFLLQLINEMPHKACHHLIKTSACEECLLPFSKTSPWIWAYGILHFMYNSGFPCSFQILVMFQLK